MLVLEFGGVQLVEQAAGVESSVEGNERGAGLGHALAGLDAGEEATLLVRELQQIAQGVGVGGLVHQQQEVAVGEHEPGGRIGQ